MATHLGATDGSGRSDAPPPERRGADLVLGTGGAACDIRLLPGQAAFLPASATLLVADLHLGKAATFRSAGIPVPEGSSQADLARLEHTLAATGAARLVILGDLLHAAVGCTPAVIGEFRALRDRFAGVSFVLVLGNHDRTARRHAPALGLDACLESLVEPPLHLVHDAAGAAPAAGALIVAGHLHPRVAVSARSGDRVVERCFHLAGGVLTLPAFGSFTGGHTLEGDPAARVWMAGDDAVVAGTGLLRAAGARRHAPFTRRPRRPAPPG